MSTSITATSITLSWTQPENSLRGDEYTISFQRLLGVDGCPSLLAPRTQISTATSLTLDNLLEGITYTINVTSSRYGFTSDPSIPAIVTTLDREFYFFLTYYHILGCWLAVIADIGAAL